MNVTVFLLPVNEMVNLGHELVNQKGGDINDCRY